MMRTKMPKLTNKEMSKEHEDFIAGLFQGLREKASGANKTRPGDVYVHDHPVLGKVLFECKVSESGRVSISAEQIAQLQEEAAQRGARPMAALRLRDPYDSRRHIDVVLKFLDDELEDIDSHG